MALSWSYGVTTVPERLRDLLPRTLASLAAAGFSAPRLFVDGAEGIATHFGLDVTYRYPRIRTFCNWWLALVELYVRNPAADRYAIFQDDFITYRNLRPYLEQWYPEKGYLNLYTFPVNQQLAKREGWYESNQRGKGAVALVFNREAVTTLLTQPHFVGRPQNAHRGHKSVDGGVVTALTKVGFKEYVHNPSLVQHTGLESSMGNKKHALATSFRGEQFDAMELLPCSATA